MNGGAPPGRGAAPGTRKRQRSQQKIDLQADLLDAVDVAVIATDLDGVVSDWNRCAEQMYGWSCEQAIGRPMTDLMVGPQDEAEAEWLMEVVRETGHWEGEVQVRRKDGSRFPAHLRNALLTDGEGQPSGMVGVTVDITERLAAEGRLRSARDYLHAVNDSMGQGLFTVDTDGRLTYINHAGEQLLGWRQDELAGQVMHDKTHYRQPDGTDFAADDRPLNEVRSDGEVIRSENQTFIRRDGSDLPVEITLAPFETEDGVRGSVVVFSDITERKADEERLRIEMEHLSWVGPIREALEEGRFVLFAQPIVHIATGRTVKHELLIRMRDADGGFIAPGEFLFVAEQYGLIAEIDRWVVRQAFELAGLGHAVGLNLSAESLAAPGLIEEFRAELARTSADPSLVVVELTETALVADEQAAVLFAERVAALGCKLALDDFGTGYGGFSYLKRLPVHFLKIDIEFVRDLLTSKASEHVVKAMVSLARGFGASTIAEGVEDDQTLRMLRELDVDYAQGYLFARPEPLADALGDATFDGP